MSEEPAARPHRPWRLLLAFLLAPVAASFVGSLVLTLNGFADRFTHPSEDEFHTITPSDVLILGTAIGATWGQLPILVLSITAHTQLMEHTTRKAWMYSAAGACAGLIFGALFVGGLLFGASGNSPADAAWLAIASASAGAVGGLVFWLIRRPDRDAPVSAPPRAAAPARTKRVQAGDT